ncbi:MAG: hypothetical protein IPH45_15855 [Bacteroidales bacterium]|nr:hypothetical protein [Bacteroidales bacterium]
MNNHKNYHLSKPFAELISLPEILLIGGNTRHSGKTTLACAVIRKYATLHPVIGLKFTRLKTGEESFHGNHSGDKESESPWSIEEETRTSGEKDTIQMIQSGARNVYYIRSTDSHRLEAFRFFLENYWKGEPIVCESRGLRDLVIPGLFILMIRKSKDQPLKEMGPYLEVADLVIESNDDQAADISRYLDKIKYSEGKWELSD